VNINNNNLVIFSKLAALQNSSNQIRVDKDFNFIIVSYDNCMGKLMQMYQKIWKPENQRFNTVSLCIYSFYVNNLSLELNTLTITQLNSLKKTLTIISQRWIYVKKNVIPKKFQEEIDRINLIICKKALEMNSQLNFLR
jgi:hypothetical protein